MTSKVPRSKSALHRSASLRFHLCLLKINNYHPRPPHASVPKTSAPPDQQVVTPWDVQGQITQDGKQLAINYDLLIDQFGTRHIDGALLDRFERLTGVKSHPLLRRGMFFSHRQVSYIPQYLGVGWLNSFATL